MADNVVQMPAPLSDREKIVKLAGMFREHVTLLGQQKATTAEMIRACLQRLKSPDSRKRAEAIKALDELATMLEKNND